VVAETRLDPISAARALWLKTHQLPTASDKVGLEAASIATIGTDQSKGDEASERVLLTSKTT